MPGSEEFVQSAVHALEAGGLVVWVKRGAVALGIAGIVVLYFYQFRSLSTSQGMDRAQIGRAIASGGGWRTKLARPLAVGQFRDTVKGEYRHWAVVIQGNQVLEKFPLKWNTVVFGFDNECIFLSDHDRERPATQ
jgi:hypothetical protein